MKLFRSVRRSTQGISRFESRARYRREKQIEGQKMHRSDLLALLSDFSSAILLNRELRGGTTNAGGEIRWQFRNRSCGISRRTQGITGQLHGGSCLFLLACFSRSVPRHHCAVKRSLQKKSHLIIARTVSKAPSLCRMVSQPTRRRFTCGNRAGT
jgi:hypothetical protein